MIVVGMDHFLSICKKKLVEWYNAVFVEAHPDVAQMIDLSQVYVVWSCKTLQNYKALLSTAVSGDGIYVEFTYNGDRQELYLDAYKKWENQCHKLGSIEPIPRDCACPPDRLDI